MTRTGPVLMLSRESWPSAAGLTAVALGAWVYVLSGAGLTMGADWTAGTTLLMLVMWWVMMAAMMLTSALPMILLYRAVNARRAAPAAAAAWIFAAGYLLAWGGFSLVAVGMQWALQEARLLSPMMQTTSMALGGALLIGAGLYQMTPLKQACLRHCRSPALFLSQHWRTGRTGALRMGAHHGLYCLGCCWVLMALLFYGGVMDPRWIGGLALYVLVEKLAPFGRRIGQFTGLVLIGWGVLVLLGA